MDRAEDLRIRKVTESDSYLILNWRNDSRIYKYFLNPYPVSKEDHIKWFDSVLKNKNILFFIAIYKNEPCGTLRYDFKEGEAEVGIYLDPNYFGKSLGLRLLNLGEKELRKTQSPKKIRARVIDENIASKKLFLKNGYKINQLIFEKELKD